MKVKVYLGNKCDNLNRGPSKRSDGFGSHGKQSPVPGNPYDGHRRQCVTLEGPWWFSVQMSELYSPFFLFIYFV